MIIRRATQADTEYVAKTVLTALDMDTSDLEWIKSSCADPQSMYSWNKSLIAEDEGKPVGCIISYSGDDYQKLREYTWSRLWKDVDTAAIKQTAIEAYPGEYYLDSLAIEPEYRGNGLGKKLMESAIQEGKELGYDKFALLVAKEKPRLKEYYATLGFEEADEVNFFGHRYKRMVRK
ncbi:MAG: GNAT family N-acetyltransferase [Muribaculaceae bacterium]|nr:GNAT family N-acetyltransferase [Muribaculaceae bacterium]MDE6631965.1 GNAT family N-acetyltransferase [Muribaculaceae bacterium]